MDEGVTITDSALLSMRVAKIHREHTRRITSIDFDPTGRLCVSAGEDEQLNLYDCHSGKHRSVCLSKKYGADHARFTHQGEYVVHASTKTDDALRYLSLYENKFIRYFSGHSKRVVSVEINPINDTFLSGATDDAVMFWDMRQVNPIAKTPITGRPCVAFDPKGLVFGIGCQSVVSLYDPRAIENGPFGVFTISDPSRRKVDWSSLKFSNNGMLMLVSTNGNVLHLLDAFTGQILNSLTGHENSAGLFLDGCFTPDSRYVLCGSQDGSVHLWDTSDGRHLSSLSGHKSACTNVAFNPSYFMFASSASHLAFWLPTEAEGYPMTDVPSTSTTSSSSSSSSRQTSMEE